ncbi:MAG: hypothetical protein IJW31_05570 [Lentisphaeria bacterium]|nr:hypothetical protein [Lentisphaeria bacterium]
MTWFCCGGKAIPNSSFRAKRRIHNYSSDQRSSRPVNGKEEGEYKGGE